MGISQAFWTKEGPKMGLNLKSLLSPQAVHRSRSTSFQITTFLQHAASTQGVC